MANSGFIITQYYYAKQAKPLWSFASPVDVDIY